MLKEIVLFIISLILLVKGSDTFTQYIKLLAQKVRIKEFVLSLILASFATTLPELTVGIISSLKGKSNLALGNAIGSVLVNSALILGICSLFYPMKVDKLAWQNSLFLFNINFLLFLFMLDMKISRQEGLILLLLYVLFLYITFSNTKREKNDDNNLRDNSIFKELILITLSIGVIIISSRFLVDSSINIARALKISELVIGLSLVAIGTSLPELANTVISIIKKTPDIGSGNIIGASILNVSVIVGISSIINPIKVDLNFLSYTMPIILITLLALTISLKRDNIIGRKTGAILFTLYLISVILNFV